MVIKLKLKPEVEAIIISQAAKKGMSIESYLESLIQEKLASQSEKIIDKEDWEYLLDELGTSASLGKVSQLSDEAISRGSIYGEREDRQR